MEPRTTQMSSIASKVLMNAQEQSLGLSIVIPVFNSGATVATLLERVTAAAARLADHYEIVLVDDGSSPDTWAAIEVARARFRDRVIAVQLMRNFGQHNALMCGLAHATGSIVVTMDDDLQNPPEEIEKLIAERQEARANRDFARSDEIRDILAEKGIVLEDTKDGVRWKRG